MIACPLTCADIIPSRSVTYAEDPDHARRNIRLFGYLRDRLGCLLIGICDLHLGYLCNNSSGSSTAYACGVPNKVAVKMIQ